MHAKMIAGMQSKDRGVQSDAFVSGLLHDVGKLVLAANFPEEYSTAILNAGESAVSTSALEYEIFGASHADVGGHLMALWGLPSSVVEAIAFHHHPSKSSSGGFSPLTAVHVADAIVRHKAAEPTASLDVDFSYLWKIGLFDRLTTWRSADPSQSAEEAMCV